MEKEATQVEPKKKITLYEYLAYNVPADVHFVLNKYGRYRKARNQKELEYQQRDFVRNFGDKGLKSLAKIHPDRKLLEIDCKSCKDKENQYLTLLKTTSTTNEVPTYFNASGNNITANDVSKSVNESENRMFNNNLLIAGLIILGVAYFTKK